MPAYGWPVVGVPVRRVATRARHKEGRVEPVVPRYALRTARPRLVRGRRTYSSGAQGKLPCASGTCSTQEAGTRNLYVQYGGPGTYVSAPSRAAAQLCACMLTGGAVVTGLWVGHRGAAGASLRHPCGEGEGSLLTGPERSPEQAGGQHVHDMPQPLLQHGAVRHNGGEVLGQPHPLEELLRGRWERGVMPLG